MRVCGGILTWFSPATIRDLKSVVTLPWQSSHLNSQMLNFCHFILWESPSTTAFPELLACHCPQCLTFILVHTVIPLSQPDKGRQQRPGGIWLCFQQKHLNVFFLNDRGQQLKVIPKGQYQLQKQKFVLLFYSISFK